MAEREMWLNLGQAADQLGMCRSWLQLNSSETGERNKVRCIRTPGGHRRFHVDEIALWRQLMGMDGRPEAVEEAFEPPPDEEPEPVPTVRQSSIEDYLLDPFQTPVGSGR